MTDRYVCASQVGGRAWAVSRIREEDMEPAQEPSPAKPRVAQLAAPVSPPKVAERSPDTFPEAPAQPPQPRAAPAAEPAAAVAEAKHAAQNGVGAANASAPAAAAAATCILRLANMVRCCALLHLPSCVPAWLSMFTIGMTSHRWSLDEVRLFRGDERSDARLLVL